MNIERALVCCVCFLSACQTVPAPTAVAPVIEPPASAHVESCSCAAPNHDVEDMLAYQHSLRQMSAAEQAKALSLLNRQPNSARVLMQKAMLFASIGGSGDLLRAQSHLDQLQASTKPDAERLKPLAALLNGMLTDRRRQEENAEKLAQQLHDEQRHAEQLNNKLEALKDIERTLQARPRPAGSVPPEPGNPHSDN